MKTATLSVQENRFNTHIAIRIAESYFDRLRGLLGRPALKGNQGLLIRPCSSIHTLGMAYSLDVVFLDSEMNIIKLSPAVRPSRVRVAGKAQSVLELSGGTIDRMGMKVGQRLQLNVNPAQR